MDCRKAPTGALERGAGLYRVDEATVLPPPHWGREPKNKARVPHNLLKSSHSSETS